MIDRKPTLAQQIRIGIEIGRAHARDPQRQIEQARRDLARHQIGFVHRGHRDQHVSILCTSGQQGAGQQAVAGNHLHIESFAQLGEPHRVLIDDRDVVVLRRQALGHRLTDPARAQDDDLHGGFMEKMGRSSVLRALRSNN